MKHCNSCDKDKPYSEFHKRAASKDGLSAKCGDCQRAYDKARANLPHRAKAREEYQQTPTGMAAARKAKLKWARENKDRVYSTTKQYRGKYPNKYRAHGKVAYAIKTGKLTRKPCEVCGESARVYGHHDDYLKPLDVRWLCDKHHKQWHKENGEGLNA